MKRLDVAYLCRNKQEYYTVLGHLHKKGYKWSSGESLISQFSPHYKFGYKDALFIDHRVSYGNIDYAKEERHGYKVLEASSLIQRITTPKLNKLPRI